MSLHAVQFYRGEKTMFATVAAFVAAGLGRHEPTVIIATPPHRSPILASLAVNRWLRENSSGPSSPQPDACFRRVSSETVSRSRTG